MLEAGPERGPMGGAGGAETRAESGVSVEERLEPEALDVRVRRTREASGAPRDTHPPRSLVGGRERSRVEESGRRGAQSESPLT